MLDSRDMRRRRSRGRAAPRRRRAILTVVLAASALLALSSLFWLLDSRPTAELPTVLSPSAGLGSPNAIAISSSLDRDRPTYGYSVIPSGAWDAQELTRAAELDPVVADHYRGVDATTMRAETLTSDRLAYVSYRVDDRVYWTKRKLLIRSGETVLTNGHTQIRSRCGNCISLTPMLPTAEDEPDETEFDRLTEVPLLVSRGWRLSGPPLAVSAPAGYLEETPVGGPSHFVPAIPFGVAPLFPSGPVGIPPNDSPPGGSSQGGLPDSPPTGTTTPPGSPTTPPGGASPPIVDGSPGNQPPVGDSSAGNPFVLDALLGNGSTPPAFSPPLSSPTRPVPEPGALVLLGSGIAGLLVRRWRLRKT